LESKREQEEKKIRIRSTSGEGGKSSRENRDVIGETSQETAATTHGKGIKKDPKIDKDPSSAEKIEPLKVKEPRSQKESREESRRASHAPKKKLTNRGKGPGGRDVPLGNQKMRPGEVREKGAKTSMEVIRMRGKKERKKVPMQREQHSLKEKKTLQVN